MNTYQCYKVLGISEGASNKEVKSAYRKLALQFHPDKNSSDQESEKFKLVIEAYQTLRTKYKNEIGTNSSKKYYDKNSKKKSDFDSQTYSWGAKKSDKTPDEDWTRYTGYAENEYQNFWTHYEKTFWDYYEKVQSETRAETEPIQVEKDISVSVNVDPGRCIACCSCETIAPSVFRVEKNVKVNPKSRVINERGANSEKILDAAQTCPTKAISVLEKESCRRLYPW
ncbi:MAG TPA: DnaJ domain-containing protein [Candidatus Nitrosotalea sp.]|nr:DnaJ domain-containing protein [Candidatus Nitrosotalea sp.]